jgi:hypothetical protein
LRLSPEIAEADVLGGGPDVDMAGALIKPLPMETGLEFRTVVGLDISTWNGSRDRT